MSVPLPVPAALPVALHLPVAAAPVGLPVPPEAARGAHAARGLRVDPQQWAQVQRRRNDPHQRRAAPAAAAKQTHKLQPFPAFPSTESMSSDSVDSPSSPCTPESPDTQVQIFEFLKTNCRTEEYVDKIVPNIVEDPRRLKDVPEMSRTLTRLPEGARDTDILEDLGHKSLQDVSSEEDDEEGGARPRKAAAAAAAAVAALPVNLLRYLDESRCAAPHQPCRRRSLSSLSLSSLSSLSQRLPLPRHLRQLTVKNIKLSLGKLCRRHNRTVVITESDPTYKVAYLGNVLTGWAKGEGCAEKPLSTLWKNYTASSKPDVNMKVAVTRSGLKATTREHGLTEYWSHRITHCAAPQAFPRVFCWVYRHEGRKLKQELRCHAVLCAREDQARRMAQQLTERLALALLEFRRDKQSREQARLSLANALHDNPSLPQRKLLLSTGASNYRPPLERSKSAPKLGSIEEAAEEEEAADVLVFGHPRAVQRFLREERLASVRRQRFRESLRRKIASRLAEEAEEAEAEDPMRVDPRRETLTVVRVNSIEEEPDPDPDTAAPEERESPVPLHHQQAAAGKPTASSAASSARCYLLEAEDAAESDEGSSSLQSISSTHSHSRTDSGEDFCLGADAALAGLALKAAPGARRGRVRGHDAVLSSWEGAALVEALELGNADADVEVERDDFDDNVSDESGYVEAAPEALRLRDHALAKACAKSCTLRERDRERERERERQSLQRLQV